MAEMEALTRFLAIDLFHKLWVPLLIVYEGLDCLDLPPSVNSDRPSDLCITVSCSDLM